MLTHFDQKGNAIMVDVTEKKTTHRVALAEGRIKVSEEIMMRLREGSIEKGDVLGIARVAGIMAAKKTSELIPMCHPLMISSCSIDFFLEDSSVKAECRVKISGQTGVEMEALTGVTVALLTIYDMCKAVDKKMCIEDVHLVAKSGGKSGDFFYDKQ